MSRTLGELIKKRTRAGDSFYVGHISGQRVTLFYVETRLSDAGEPIEVWELGYEPTRQHPARQQAGTGRDRLANPAPTRWA